MTYSPKITNAEQLGTGTPDGTKFLRDDLSWDDPPGGGGITELTGDVTASGTGSVAATIASGAVTLAKQANLAANSIVGNNTGSPATPIALTTAQTKALLSIAASDVSGLGTLATQNGTFSGTSSGTNTGDVTLAGTPDYITISGQTITRNAVDLAADVTGDLPWNHIVQVSSASKLIGRGDASAGYFQEITLGTNLTMSGTTLNATGGGSGASIDDVLAIEAML